MYKRPNTYYFKSGNFSIMSLQDWQLTSVFRGGARRGKTNFGRKGWALPTAPYAPECLILSVQESGHFENQTKCLTCRILIYKFYHCRASIKQQYASRITASASSERNLLIVLYIHLVIKNIIPFEDIKSILLNGTVLNNRNLVYHMP